MPAKRFFQAFLPRWTAFFVFFAFFALVFSQNSPAALYFRLDGDRLWMEADREPLTEVLHRFSLAGVDVFTAPDIHGEVTGSIRGQNLDDALPNLLGTYDYLLTWKMMRTPLGRRPKLREIRVFTQGRPAATRPMEKRSSHFEVTRGADGSGPEFVKDELLLAVRPGTTLPQFQNLLDAVGGMWMDAQNGVYLIRFPAGTDVEALLERIRSEKFIARAELNFVSRLPAAEEGAAAFTPVTGHLTPPADGSIPVAVLDSGFDPSSRWAPLLSGAWDAVEPGRAIADPNGHGTQMSAIAAGALGVDGLSAPTATAPVVAVRAFDENGATSDFAILQALACAKEAGARVVNMSWGSTTDSAFLRDAVRQATHDGLLLVAAAGNNGDASPVYPAAYDAVLAVGGVTADGAAWDGASRGDYVDLSASAFSTRPGPASGQLVRLIGTSISSAAVANALTAYLNLHPKASAADARSALLAALSSPAADGYGAGTLDASALRRLLGESTDDTTPP